MRLTAHEDGWIYGLFCAERKDPAAAPGDLSSAVAQCGIARTRDLRAWERLDDLRTRSAQQRNCVLHPEFVDGKYAFYTRPQDSFIEAGRGGGIGWGLASNMEHAAIEEETILDQREYHTITEVKNGLGPGPAQDRRRAGCTWLTACAIRRPGLRYVLYCFLCDLKAPYKVIAKPGGYFLAPEGEERVGDVSNVAFSNGWVRRGDEVLIYYGASDTRTYVAATTVERLLDYVLNTPPDPLRSAACVRQRIALIEKNLRMAKVPRMTDADYSDELGLRGSRRSYSATSCRSGCATRWIAKTAASMGRSTAICAVEKESPRAAVINARILWTYSAACRLYGAEYREMADWAYDYIVKKFWDAEHGGVYWMLDYQGKPLSDRKQIYAQAFAAYGMAEYFRATGKPESLELAQRLFHLIEEHSYDSVWKGYLEARGRDWSALADMRLSEKDLNSPKSMNTHLHVMEAYTNLLRVWKDPELEAKQKELLEVTMDRIVDSSTGHFKLFFDNQWNSLTDHISFGHDIEGSWLMLEAAEVLGDPALVGARADACCIHGGAVYEQGLDQDGSLFYEANSGGRDDRSQQALVGAGRSRGGFLQCVPGLGRAALCGRGLSSLGIHRRENRR